MNNLYKAGKGKKDIDCWLEADSSKFLNILSWCNESSFEIFKSLKEGNIHTFHQSYFNQWKKMKLGWYHKTTFQNSYYKYLTLIFDKRIGENENDLLWEKKATDSRVTQIAKNIVCIGILKSVVEFASEMTDEEKAPILDQIEVIEKFVERKPLINNGILNCSPDSQEMENELSKVICHLYGNDLPPSLKSIVVQGQDDTLIVEVAEHQWVAHLKVAQKIDWGKKRAYFMSRPKEFTLVQFNNRWHVELDMEIGTFLKGHLGRKELIINTRF